MHHTHAHVTTDTNKAFLLSAALNTVFVIVEVIFGFLANSLALLADAGHNFVDILTLLLAWGANTLANIKPTNQRTYGYRRATILAALFSSIALLGTMMVITYEAIQRLQSTVEAQSILIIIVAAVGVVINFVTAALFLEYKDSDLNVKGAFLHLLADGLVSVAVVFGGLIIFFTGWLLVDPILSLLIVVIIAYSGWGLLKDSFNLSVDAVPPNIDIEEVKTYLLNLPGVTDIHDLHIWAMSTTQVAMTAHIVRETTSIDDEFLHQTTNELRKMFGIHHTTIQIENDNCLLNCQK